MKKIPVGATLAQAGRFVIRDFFRILGVSAIPLVIMWIPSLLLRKQMTDISAQFAAHDFSAIQHMMAILLPFYIIMLVMMAMQMIGIARLALGLQRSWFYFSLGKTVWRLIGSVLLLLLAALIGYLVALFGGILLAVAMGFIAKSIAITAINWLIAAVSVIGITAIWCAYIYSLVRLSFLLCPIIATEEDGFALGNSWTLGRGNFWRMFAIILIILVPLMAIEAGLLFGWLFKGVTFPPPHASVDQLAAYNAVINEHTIAMMNAMYQYWYISFPILIVFCVLFYGFSIGVQCFAYQALKDGDLAPIAGD